MPHLLTAVKYLLAGAIPIMIAAVWPGPDAARPIAAYVFFLLIACAARFFGFGPALVCTAASTAMLWIVVLLPGLHPMSVQWFRLGSFAVASLVISSVSLQRSVDVRRTEVESARRLEALFDSVIDAIFFFDSEGHYIDANPAATELLGISREEILQGRLGDFSSTKDRPNVGRLFQQLLVEGKMRGEWLVVRKDGTTRDTEFTAVANILPGVHCLISHDVTGRKEAERSLRKLSRRLLHLQEEERRRIARDLHDTTAQNLTALRLNLSWLLRSSAAVSDSQKDALNESLKLTDESISEIRTLSYLLHPPMIEQAGLLPTLRWYVRGFETRSGIRVTLDVDDELGRLPREVETVLFRVIQEALTNVHRHSGSSVARIRMERQDHSVRLQVEDEGRGVPKELLEHMDVLAAHGVGVAGMKERVEDLGGDLRIESANGGTRLIATVPVAEMTS